MGDFMLKKVINLLKKVVFSSFFLYGYNLLAAPLNLIIPINLINILLLSLLGVPALFGLIFIFVFVF